MGVSELKAIALEEYEFWDPDTVIVEATGEWDAVDARIAKYGDSCSEFYRVVVMIR